MTKRSKSIVHDGSRYGSIYFDSNWNPNILPGRPAAHLPIVDENEAVPEPHRADGLWGWGTSGANGQQVSARGKWGAVKKIFPFGLESKLPCCGCGELMGHMSYVDRMIKKL